MGEAVTDERSILQDINIDALPEDMYSTVKMQSTTDPDLGLQEIIWYDENDIYKPFGELVRQFPKEVKRRTVKFGIALVSPE